eukprot:TRINITY_DN28886_c0_g1_i1.p1 TRINITY_DN28886_c0_g1~~TRINITY_DN28886_c0_g1_i1.p1  ORF type:complete len:841 (+),score=209.10 TRINITY_DN28886_c0_g1_i1:83-2524(+)
MAGAGELYEVYGQTKWGPGSGCPAELVGRKVKLKSREGKETFVLPAEAAALSLRLRSQLLDAGCEEVLELPFSGKVVQRLVDYLKHHKEHAAGEIKTPLRSDELAQCGATRWDASYANMEKELFFDVSLASRYLDIPSLSFLLMAKASLMHSNKTAERLRKECNMTNDLPNAEEAELKREYDASRARRGEPEADLSQLAAACAMRNAMLLAEERTGVRLNDDDLPSSTVTLKSWRTSMWREAVAEDWKLLAHAPEAVRSDSGVVRSALAASQGEALKYAAPELRANESLVLQATQFQGRGFENAAPDLRSSKEFVLKAVGANGAALGVTSDAFRSDRSLLLQAAKAGHGSALQGAAPQLRSDRNFVLEMVVHDAEAYKYAHEDLLNDREFALAAVRRNGLALQHMLPGFKADVKIVQEAVARSPGAASFAHTARRNEIIIDKTGTMYGEAQMQAEVESQARAAGAKASLCSAEALGFGIKHQLPVKSMDELQEQQDKEKSKTILKLHKTVHFTAQSTIFPNIGQCNKALTRRNSFLDKLPGCQRPEIEAVSIMWGAIGGIGMRLKAFASKDILNSTPDVLLSIKDASKALYCCCVGFNNPEWYAAAFHDEWTRQAILQPTAGQIKLERKEAAKAAEAQWEELVDADRDALSQRRRVDRRPLPGNFADAEERSAPLGGWPGLQQTLVQLPTGSALPLEEGTRVELHGLGSKSGLAGTLTQQCPDGKWKVRLDDGAGCALLRQEFFRPVERAPGSAGSAPQATSCRASLAPSSSPPEERRSQLEQRRAELKAKIAARRQANAKDLIDAQMCVLAS